MSTPREAVIKAILVQMNIDAVSDTDRLVEDLRMDSLDILEAVMAVESEFDTRISDDKVEALNTVADFINLVEVSV